MFLLKWLKKKKIAVAAAILILAASGFLFLKASRNANSESLYRFVEIQGGDLENIVSSTGTISAVGTVEVGTQVSGRVEKVLVDFNDDVTKDQVLAILDTTNLAMQVRDAEANITRTKAQFDQAEFDYNNTKALFDKKLVSELELRSKKTAFEVNRANYQSALASLERARTNLKYAIIRSPIDGKVLYRNIDPGQTVAASFNTPQLFVIAEDLSRVEIHAQVDESDVGQIKPGQVARFTVQAHMDEIFNGTVRQIWLQPTTIQNVVMYTVLIDADNNGLLLPGMTATVDFIVEQVEDALLVPNAALRFTPTMAMLEEFRKNRQASMGAHPDSVEARMQRGMEMGMQRGMGMGNRGPGGRGPSEGTFQRGQSPRNAASLWFLGEDSNLRMTRISTGVSDGRLTEIKMGRDITVGMKVISGINKQDGSQTTPAQSQGRSPMRMMRLF
ncbi:Multidrug resistance protein MdtA [subsurface metagenome]